MNLIGPFGQKVGDDLAKIWPKFVFVGAKFGGKLVRHYRLNYYGQGHYWPNSLTLLQSLQKESIVVLFKKYENRKLVVDFVLEYCSLWVYVYMQLYF